MDTPAPPGAQVYEFGPFRLDTAGRVLLRDNRIVALPPKVLDTLVLLVENRGRLVTKEELLRSIWPDTYVEPNSLMHNVSVLRKALGDAPDGKPYIETAPRRGYRFVGTVRTGNEPPEKSELARFGRLHGLAALGAGLLIVATAVGAIWERPGAVLPLQVTPLTTYPGTEAFPTFSPDGRQVAFVWNGEKQDQFDIYVKTIGVDAPRRLTSDAESECHLAWSPDGGWIAFTYCETTDANAPPGKVGLYVIPSAGGPRQRIGNILDGGGPSGSSFTWAADSKALISAKAEGGAPDTGLFVLSIEAALERGQLTRPQPGSWDTDPALSPDGRTLAFVRCTTHGLCDIYLVGLDQELAPEGQPRRLTNERDFITNLLWINGGAELLYVAGHNGARGVWRIRARPGAAPKQAQALAHPGVHLALSRQGKLAYSRQYWDYDIWRAELDGSPTSSKAAALIASTFSDAEPKYSPDGKSIAFQSNRSGVMEIWRSHADGTDATQVTSLHGEAGSPAWSPDGTEIAFDCRLDGNVDIYVAGARDGKVRRLTKDPGVHTTPSWSHDGKWIYFPSKRTGRLEVWKVGSQGGDAVQVTRTGGFLAYESSDGQFLFYAKTSQFPTTLWRMSLATGQDEQIIDSLGNWFYFAVFDDGIYFIPDRGPSAPFTSFQLNFLDFRTRNVRTVAEVAKWPGVGFSISPDRRSFLFAPTGTRGSDLMLVENFR